MNDFIETFGPSYRWSDHKSGEMITYTLDGDGKQHTGEILHIIAPGHALSGAPHTTLYIVMPDDREGFPDYVAPTEVVATAVVTGSPD